MSIEKGIERGFQFVESFAGGVLDLVMGRGGDGVPFSSAEDYIRPDPGQQPGPRLGGCICGGHA